MYRIGIDVGGTNTDAVIIDQKKSIIAKTKQLTTPDIESGISASLTSIIAQANINLNKITHIMLGTTQCTNALVERKNLNKIAHIRIGSPAAHAIPPLPEWPTELLSNAAENIFQTNGGFEFNGTPISPLNEQEIINILKSIKSKVSAISVAGIFSKIDPSQEIRCKELASRILGDNMPVSMSHHIGALGLLERESATAINAMLTKIASRMIAGFKNAVATHRIDAALYISQNDGSLMSLEQAKKFPVLTISSGPTNSLRGASALSGIDNAIVIDVGGTTSDAGILINNQPRESSKHSNIGGIRTNFRMPDIVSTGLGGGTIVNISDKRIDVGPQSVGYNLNTEAKCFGGKKLTLTDIAMARKTMQIQGASTKKLDIGDLPNKVMAIVRRKIEHIIDSLKTEAKDIPVVVVGGGAPILPTDIRGATGINTPLHGEVANAFGVAVANISGEAESVINLTHMDREKAIKKIKEKARNEAIRAGADPGSTTVSNITDTPLAYLPNTTKIKVKVIGEIK